MGKFHWSTRQKAFVKRKRFSVAKNRRFLHHRTFCIFIYMGYALDFVAVSCEFELFCCMIGASDQRAGFNMTEAHLLSLILQVFEFIGMVETFYWKKLFSRAEVLSY